MFLLLYAHTPGKTAIDFDRPAERPTVRSRHGGNHGYHGKLRNHGSLITIVTMVSLTPALLILRELSLLS